jgi:hypothetical protein
LIVGGLLLATTTSAQPKAVRADKRSARGDGNR